MPYHKNYTKEIVYMMCGMAGVDPDTVNFKEEGWYAKHEWTVEEENAYRAWLTDYLSKDLKAWRNLTGLYIRTPMLIGKFIAEFLFYCGWKIKEDTH